MALGFSVRTKSVHERFEDLLHEYRAHQSRDNSYFERGLYEELLGQLRHELRQRPTSHRLGDLLTQMGAIDPTLLEDGLAIQRAEGKKRLLGEILTDRGWIDERALGEAIALQSSAKAAATAVPRES